MKWPCSRAMLNYHRVIHRSWVITQFLRQTPISLHIETVHTWRSCKVHTWRSSWSGMQHAVYAVLKGAFFLCNSVLVYVRKRKNNISLWITYLLIFFWRVYDSEPDMKKMMTKGWTTLWETNQINQIIPNIFKSKIIIPEPCHLFFLFKTHGGTVPSLAANWYCFFKPFWL